MAHLPPWQDVAVEHFTRSLLNADLLLTSHPQARPLFSAVYQSFFQKDATRRPECVGQTRILLAGGWSYCPQRQPCSSSVAC